MKLSEAMRERMLLSFELFPPKTEKGMDNLPGTIDHLMKYKPAYISCTYGAGGGNVGANREVCQMIKKAGTVPVTHFTVIKNTKEGIKEQLDQYLAEGVDQNRISGRGGRARIRRRGIQPGLWGFRDLL